MGHKGQAEPKEALKFKDFQRFWLVGYARIFLQDMGVMPCILVLAWFCGFELEASWDGGGGGWVSVGCQLAVSAEWVFAARDTRFRDVT
ncbi:MAG: hypothetical protein LBS11_11455 [Oscillospiraceae bacterium]|jgi:hypothetical protein|nr:hypothetical protein [Oscillospiraceae bacterium]